MYVTQTCLATENSVIMIDTIPRKSAGVAQIYGVIHVFPFQYIIFQRVLAPDMRTTPKNAVHRAASAIDLSEIISGFISVISIMFVMFSKRISSRLYLQHLCT